MSAKALQVRHQLPSIGGVGLFEICFDEVEAFDDSSGRYVFRVPDFMPIRSQPLQALPSGYRTNINPLGKFSNLTIFCLFLPSP
jgi:hypothetical protein